MMWCRGIWEFTLFTGNYGQTSPSSVRCADSFPRRGKPFTPAAILYRNPEAAVPAPWRGWPWPGLRHRGARIAVDIVTLLRRFCNAQLQHRALLRRLPWQRCAGRRQSAGQHASAAHSPVWRWPSSLASPSSSISPSRAILRVLGRAFSTESAALMLSGLAL